MAELVPCKGLGTRLRDLETGGKDKRIIEFTILDWILDGHFYVMLIPAGLHLRGKYPIMGIERLVGAEYEAISLDGLLVDASGNVTLRVCAVPDGRFGGRAIFT